MSSCMHWTTCSYVMLSRRTKGAMYVSKEENAWAPAHSFWSVPRKFTIWPHAEEKWRGGAEAIAPLTPLKPSWMRRLRDHPAQ